jgi:hypothetical protein
MATNSKDIFSALQSSDQEPDTTQPNNGLDGLVAEIFTQASNHRNVLVHFYIWYTCILSLLVMGMLFWQAAARFFVFGDERLELIPPWALNLIVVGMFGQFIGLLTIVTKKVWEFKPFLDHAQKNQPKK